MQNDLQPETVRGFWRLYATRERGWLALGFLVLCIFVQQFFSHPDFLYRNQEQDKGVLNCRDESTSALAERAKAMVVAGGATKNQKTCTGIDLQLAFKPDRFRAVLQTWDSIIIFKQSVRQVDFLFPLAYAWFLAFAYAWSRRNRQPKLWDKILFLAPLLAALCDYCENTLLLNLLRSVNEVRQVESASFSSVQVLAASSFALTKIILLSAVFWTTVLILGWRAVRLVWSWLQQLGTAVGRGFAVLPYVYLLRFPTLTALAMVGLAYVSFFTGTRSLLENLFDLKLWGIFWVSLVSFLLAWGVMATQRLILLCGWRRFKVLRCPIGRKFSTSYLMRYGMLALPMIFGALIKSGGDVPWGVAGGAMMATLGLVASLATVWFATLFQRFLSPPKSKLAHVDLLLPETSPGQQYLESAGDAPLRPWAQRLMNKVQWFFEQLGPGYVDRRSKEILPGHGLAMALFVVCVIIYGAVGTAKALLLGSAFNIPALAYVLWLLLLLCWGLTSFSFYLDRYRLPVLIPLLLLLTVTAQFPQADHFYDLLLSRQSNQPASPEKAVQVQSQILAEEPSADSMIVVATSGGGIQAAAWTAQVLAGLENEFPREFGRRVRLISAVSGGSVGAMYFANAYRDGELEKSRLDAAIEQSMHSSLDEVAWGVVYPDFLRLFCPFCFGTVDRGQALEMAFERVDETTKTTLVKATLSQWRSDAERGKRPDLIFNTTITDTGERLLLATSAPAQRSQQKTGNLGKGSRNFSDIYPDGDLKVVTAARLSAAFPYASPAARANRTDLTGGQFHIVDGGYYDNYGVSSLAEWLNEALERQGSIRRVLLVQIRAFPVGGTEKDNADQPRNQPPTQRGWFYQAFAPVATLLNVRTAGQFAHNQVELDLLKQVLGFRGIELKNVEFEFQRLVPGADQLTVCHRSGKTYEPPLSWHLTERQKNEVRREWEWTKNCGEVQKVREFLHPPTPPFP